MFVYELNGCGFESRCSHFWWFIFIVNKLWFEHWNKDLHTSYPWHSLSRPEFLKMGMNGETIKCIKEWEEIGFGKDKFFLSWTHILGDSRGSMRSILYSTLPLLSTQKYWHISIRLLVENSLIRATSGSLKVSALSYKHIHD